ncbi:glycosyltransferase family 25 protein [Myriangium duriaei CBS 260.36]|uniref:Glycosyltransferase family 25 protein n=1 Tax=Myriangium duriaei CBS 260.36 TaxID=1168546 RepID=A0A9P4J3X2_9PEZI|nr:glycosyltransferase family 25 protein [Myriangium duriaei CBS 260.36]
MFSFAPLSPPYTFSSNPPANATLGFGAIYAISGHDSPRRQGLLEAANVTGLDLQIPVIPEWTQDQVDDFRDNDHLENSTILDGSIKAWLSHNVALKEFLNSGKETALFIEDDVDWDIRLRTSQVPKTAAAQRELLPKAAKRHYWGNPEDWDLLYIGHCGDYFTSVDSMHVGVGIVHPADLDDLPHAVYPDTTLPDPSDMHPFTVALLTAFNLPPKTRVVHKSVWPLCTFGYAVTRRMAAQIVDELAPPMEVPNKHTHAYDIAILEACRDKGYRCFTVNPELFHHMEGVSLIDGVAKTKDHRPPADRVGTAQVRYRNETSNIGCGFWSKDFRWKGDMQRLAYLREEVGRKGRCLKPGRMDDGSRVEPLATARRHRRVHHHFHS